MARERHLVNAIEHLEWCRQNYVKAVKECKEHRFTVSSIYEDMINDSLEDIKRAKERVAKLQRILR